MLLGNPCGPATFVSSPKRMSLSGRLGDSHQAAGYWTGSMLPDSHLSPPEVCQQVARLWLVPDGQKIGVWKVVAREREVKVLPRSCRAAGVRPDGLQQQRDEAVAFVWKGKDRNNDLLLVFAQWQEILSGVKGALISEIFSWEVGATVRGSQWIRTFHTARWEVGEGSQSRRSLFLRTREDIPQCKVQHGGHSRHENPLGKPVFIMMQLNKKLGRRGGRGVGVSLWRGFKMDVWSARVVLYVTGQPS